MPGGSSTALSDTPKMESPAPLLGAVGQAGSVDPVDPDGIKDKLNPTMHSAALTTEGVC